MIEFNPETRQFGLVGMAIKTGASLLPKAKPLLRLGTMKATKLAKPLWSTATKTIGGLVKEHVTSSVWSHASTAVNKPITNLN